MISSTLLITFFLFFIVAFLYASVGHGGASGYMAIMSLLSFTTIEMKPIALILNIIVSIISFAFFYKQKHFDWKLFYPFAITSIPFSFLGSLFELKSKTYKIILAIILIVAILRMLGVLGEERKEIRILNFKMALLIGAFIGLVSGLLGIGGGIILSPIILILGWGNLQKTAAVSALFIFVNSISGLIGILTRGVQIPEKTIYIVFAVVVGGIIGGYYGSNKFKVVVLKYILALVLSIACIKLIIV